jgi:hemerythrin-like domain-containing protein
VETTRSLREEHRLILAVLDALEVAVRRAESSGRVRREVFGPFVEFFRGFADRCHHGKEEDRLFPCLERCGVPREGGPIGVMLEEHRLGRGHVRAMGEALEAAEGGDAGAAGAVLAHARDFLELLRDHIRKEDHVLFEIADRVVPEDDRRSLARAYEEAESDRAYRDTRARCEALAGELLERYGIARPG